MSVADPNQRALVFAADTLIRSRGGRLLLHTTASKLPAFESDQPMVIGWLCQFARPCRVADALSGLAESDREQAAQIIAYLERGGTLVPAGDAAAAADDATTTTARTRAHLRLLARTLYETACDTLAFGPWIEQDLAARTGIGLERRLTAMLMGLDSLRHELAEARGRHLQEQLHSLGVATGQGNGELKLHIGAGEQRLEGWLNIDVHPAQLAMNVLRPLPFAAGSVRAVFVSHLLEHLYYPRDVHGFLRELHRTLRPGGRVRIVVPDIEKCIEAYTQHDTQFFASRRETWSWWPENPTRLEDFLAYSGAGPEPGLLFESHKYGYDFETLRKVLEECGFADVQRSEFMASAHPELRVDEHSAVAGARYGQRYYSLFVEAARPL
jgi:predicted SAM-dependent methyltransferase